MSFTTHNNFEIPDTGVQNWEASLNENFELQEKGQTITATAGTTLSIAVSSVVYMNSSERLELAISPSGITIASQFLGFTTTDIVTEIDGYVQINGNHGHVNWAFTPGPVYLDASDPGQVTQTEPTRATLVGYAIGTNELVIKPWVDTEFSTLYTDTISPLAADYINISAGLTIQASTQIITGTEDLQTTLTLEQQDQDEGFIEFTGLAVTGGTSSLDLDTGELGAVFGKAQVKVNGVTKWIRLYDDET